MNISEQDSSLEFEQKLVVVDEWVSKLSEDDRLTEIDRDLLRGVLEEFGANFDLEEEVRKSLSSYKNADRASVMREVWGRAL